MKNPELEENESTEWYGYTIKRKLDFAPHAQKIGYVVTKEGCNVMPGATWFSSIAEAQKGIAAWVLTCKLAPINRVLPKLENGNSDVFWMLMELSK